MSPARPRLLFHCQHALGLGHLARSLSLADGLQRRFDVTLLNGGRFPSGTAVPAGVEVLNLDPLGHDAGYQLVSHDPALSVAEVMVRRTATVLATLERVDPAVVVVELYPFGRKKFRFELEPLLAAVHRAGPSRARVACSVRDILVNRRRDQAGHDDRAAQRANAWFDLVLVHADPAFATLEESFRPLTPLEVPVVYTGFVTSADGAPAITGPRLPRILVSAGGGMAGAGLLGLAAAAAGPAAAQFGLTTTLVAGPFLPADDLAALRARAEREPALEVVPRVDDLAAEIARSAVSVSQCGYNTSMDLLRAGRPALVVPFADGQEDEQTRRAERLERLGIVSTLAAAGLTVDRYLDGLAAVVGTAPPSTTLDLGGRERSAALLGELSLGRTTDPVAALPPLPTVVPTGR